MPHDKLNCGSDLPPLAPILLLCKLVWERWGGLGLLIIPYPLYNTIHPHYDHCTHDLILTPSANCATSSMPLLGLILYFSSRVNPPPQHLPKNDDIFPYILSLSLFSLSLSPQIIASHHLLVSWWTSNLSSQSLTLSYLSLLTLS